MRDGEARRGEARRASAVPHLQLCSRLRQRQRRQAGRLIHPGLVHSSARLRPWLLLLLLLLVVLLVSGRSARELLG